MIYEDDRTDEERVTHRKAVVMRDKFLSGWGGARGGYSRAAWAIPNDGSVDVGKVYNWVKSRGDALYVSTVDLKTYRPPRGTVHFHVYVVDKDHPAAGG